MEDQAYASSSSINEPIMSQMPTRRDQIDQIHKKITAQMRQNVALQSELQKCIGTFRVCADSMAQASDEIAKVVSKAALITMSSHQTLKDYRRMRGDVVTKEEELKQRKLSAALQQMVKFQTLLSTQQQLVSNALLLEFDRPIGQNYERYRDVMQMWEKDYDREIRRIQSEIRHKESESAKLGKSQKNLDKLSAALYELSSMVTELERNKMERLEAALSIDRHQHLMLAHHLQQCLKAQVQCHKNVYYQQNNPVPSANTATAQASAHSASTTTLHSKNVVLHVNTAGSTPVVGQSPAQQSGGSSGSSNGTSDNSGDSPDSERQQPQRQDTQQATPMRRQSSGLATTPLERSPRRPSDAATEISEDEFDEYTRSTRKNSSFFGSSLPPSANKGKMAAVTRNIGGEKSSATGKSPMPPSRVSSRYDNMEGYEKFGISTAAQPQSTSTRPTAAATATDADKKPRAPQNPHRKTMAPPDTTDVLQLRQHIMGATDSKSTGNSKPVFRNSALGISPDVRGDASEQQQQQQQQQSSSLSTSLATAEGGETGGGDGSSFDERGDSKDWAVVQYDYTAQTDDDLTVYENDVLRVVAVEGEWMYALLLERKEGGGGYVPAKVDGRHQAGWVPHSFTEPY